jgi:hypothetical protein
MFGTPKVVQGTPNLTWGTPTIVRGMPPRWELPALPHSFCSVFRFSAFPPAQRRVQLALLPFRHSLSVLWVMIPFPRRTCFHR